MLRWAEFLAAYNYTLKHRPGKSISHADALSRCPLPTEAEDPAPETSIHFIESLAASLITAAEVARETAKDRRLARILNWILRGWPDKCEDEEVTPFKRRQTELSTLKGCILWGDRVVIPHTLQDAVLRKVHHGHPGIVKMKALARSYVWWPGIDKNIENWVATCTPCQLTRPAAPTAPVQPWETPSAPWSRIHIDFAGPCQGKTYLITVDAYSKWLEITLMTSTTTEAVIKALRGLFATHGLPDTVASDNGPQFTSNSFETFLADLGIRHALSAPAHPATNGQAERAVRSTKEALARLSGKDTQEKIDRVLLAQHTTPHATTNKSPAELLMGRKLRTILDRLHPRYTPEKPVDSSSKCREFLVNDRVYAKNLTGEPLWVPAQVTQRTGPKSYRVVTDDGKDWRRHIDQLRARKTRGEADSSLRDSTEGGEERSSLHGNTTGEREGTAGREKEINQHLPERRAETGGEPQERNQQPVSPSGRSGGPQRKEKPSEEQEFQKVPAQTEGTEQNSTAHGETQTMSDLRRSSRARTRPAYLQDYVKYTDCDWVRLTRGKEC